MGLSDKAEQVLGVLDQAIKNQQSAVDLRADVIALKQAIEICEGNEGRKMHLQFSARPGAAPFAVEGLELAGFLAAYVEKITVDVK